MSEISTLAEIGIFVRSEMTRPTRPGKQPREVWIISGATRGYEDILKEIGCRKFGGRWSCFEYPSLLLVDAINDSGGKRSFEERLEVERQRAEERADRYEDRATKASREASALSKRSDQISERFHMGQPILVGHHSEKGARRDQERMWNLTRKSIDASNKAGHYAGRAAASERRANAEHTVDFMCRRVEDAETEIRKLEKRIEQAESLGGHEEYIERITGVIADAKDRADYWRAKIEEAGGVRYSRETVKKGSFIRYRGTWYPVKRVNPKSVTISHWLGIPTFTWTVPYAEIGAMKEAEQS